MSSIDDRFRTIEHRLVLAIRNTEDAHRRIANMVRFVKVSRVDHKNYRIKAIWGETPDGEPIETPWFRWSTRAGKIKEWSPPSVGEQIMMISPSGTIGTASWGAPGGYSNSNPPNHDQDGEWKMTIGNTSMTIKDGEIKLNTKKLRVETPGGKVEFDNSNSSIATPPQGMDASDIPMS